MGSPATNRWGIADAPRRIQARTRAARRHVRGRANIPFIRARTRRLGDDGHVTRDRLADWKAAFARHGARATRHGSGQQPHGRDPGGDLNAKIPHCQTDRGRRRVRPTTIGLLASVRHRDTQVGRPRSGIILRDPNVRRDALKQHIDAAGIATSSHYPRPAVLPPYAYLATPADFRSRIETNPHPVCDLRRCRAR